MLKYPLEIPAVEGTQHSAASGPLSASTASYPPFTSPAYRTSALMEPVAPAEVESVRKKCEELSIASPPHGTNSASTNNDYGTDAAEQLYSCLPRELEMDHSYVKYFKDLGVTSQNLLTYFAELAVRDRELVIERFKRSGINWLHRVAIVDTLAKMAEVRRGSFLPSQ